MRIVFVSNNLVVGGVERALIDNINLLQELGHDVSLLLREREGTFLNQLSSKTQIYEVPILDIERYQIRTNRIPALMRAFVTGQWVWGLRMLARRLVWVLGGREGDFDFLDIQAQLRRTQFRLAEQYDLAVAWFADGPWSTLMTLLCVSARRKVTWAHGECCTNRFSPALFRLYYSRFDAHFACSGATAERINHALGIEGLVVRFPHLISTAKILDLGREKVDDIWEAGTFYIVTVGRICSDKAPDVAISAFARLRSSVGSTAPIKWLWIGPDEGGMRERMEQKSAELRMAEDFIFLGAKVNPYPYMRKCDCYVQPSRHDGFGLTVSEAKAFCRPIVVTDFDGAHEQVENGETGIIVPRGENMDVDVAQAIERIYSDDAFRQKLSGNLANVCVDNREEVSSAWETLLTQV